MSVEPDPTAARRPKTADGFYVTTPNGQQLHIDRTARLIGAARLRSSWPAVSRSSARYSEDPSPTGDW